ncbi:MAG TPA: helix-hairpin-helix domain-containing protein [Pseudonocardiaceae bacterium]
MDPALAKALDARAKRAQARELVAQDPLLAEELHIGRPDLGRTFDDGGLVDINHATAKAMASAFGIKPVDARTIIERRDELGGFANVDEMLVLVDLPVAAWDRIRDRSITLSA